MLDVLVAAAVEEAPRDDPPPSPVAGSSYIVGPAPTGEWAGHQSCLASFTAAGWRFVQPIDGLQAWVKATLFGRCSARESGSWDHSEPSG